MALAFLLGVRGADAGVHGRRQGPRLRGPAAARRMRSSSGPAAHRLRAPAGSPRPRLPARQRRGGDRRWPSGRSSRTSRCRPSTRRSAWIRPPSSRRRSVFGVPRRSRSSTSSRARSGRPRPRYDTQSLQQAKATAQVVSDVSSAMAGYESVAQLVERMEKAAAAERGARLLRSRASSTTRARPR